jgi:hypothetical protein
MSLRWYYTCPMHALQWLLHTGITAIFPARLLPFRQAHVHMIQPCVDLAGVSTYTRVGFLICSGALFFYEHGPS